MRIIANCLPVRMARPQVEHVHVVGLDLRQMVLCSQPINRIYSGSATQMAGHKCGSVRRFGITRRTYIGGSRMAIAEPRQLRRELVVCGIDESLAVIVLWNRSLTNTHITCGERAAAGSADGFGMR